MIGTDVHNRYQLRGEFEMRKNTWISLIALGVATVGVLIALIAFFKRNRCTLCEDFEDEEMPDLSDDEEISFDQDAAECTLGCEDCEDCEETCCAQQEIPPEAVVEEKK